jgi:hypothetical protein
MVKGAFIGSIKLLLKIYEYHFHERYHVEMSGLRNILTDFSKHFSATFPANGKIDGGFSFPITQFRHIKYQYFH